MRGETETTSDDRAAAVTAAPQRPRRLRLLDEFTAERQVFEPHRVGLPPLIPYIRTLWQRREFAFELSRTELRAQHFNTVFGQLWLVLNPLLLALVYFILVDILRHHSRGAAYLAHLMAGLFAYYFVQGSIREGAKTVVNGGKLILNTAFPRVLLPLAAVLTAFMRFLPTFVVYGAMHAVAGLPLRATVLWTPLIIFLLAVLALGLAMLVAALQVYFRDLQSFLPYLLRIWLYVSPVLYYAHEVPGGYSILLKANPLAPLLIAWSDALNQGITPPAKVLALGAAWAFVLFVVGGWFFVSRERDFAVRI
jgi:teichoic acid transport system permease protein